LSSGGWFSGGWRWRIGDIDAKGLFPGVALSDHGYPGFGVGEGVWVGEGVAHVAGDAGGVEEGCHGGCVGGVVGADYESGVGDYGGGDGD